MPELKDLIKIFKYVKTLNECCKDTNNTTYSCAVQKDKENRILVDAYFNPDSYTKTKGNYAASDKPYQFINAYMEDLRYFKMLDPPVDTKTWKGVHLDQVLKQIVWTNDSVSDNKVSEPTIQDVMDKHYRNKNIDWQSAVGGGLNLNNIISLSKKEQSGFVPYEVYDLKGSYTDEYLNQMNSKIKKYYNLFGGFKKISEEVTGSITDLDNLLRNDLENQVINSLNKKYYKDYKVTSQTGGSGSRQVHTLWDAYWGANDEDRQVFDCIAFFRYRPKDTTAVWQDLRNTSTKPTDIDNCEIRVNLNKLKTSAPTSNQSIFEKYFRTHYQQGIPIFLMMLPDNKDWNPFIYFAANYWLGPTLDTAPEVNKVFDEEDDGGDDDGDDDGYDDNDRGSGHGHGHRRVAKKEKEAVLVRELLGSPTLIQLNELENALHDLDRANDEAISRIEGAFDQTQMQNRLLVMWKGEFLDPKYNLGLTEDNLAHLKRDDLISILRTCFKEAKEVVERSASARTQAGTPSRSAATSARTSGISARTLSRSVAAPGGLAETSGVAAADIPFKTTPRTSVRPPVIPSSAVFEDATATPMHTRTELRAPSAAGESGVAASATPMHTRTELRAPVFTEVTGGKPNPLRLRSSNSLEWWRSQSRDPEAATHESKIRVKAAHLHQIWNCDDYIFDKIADINQIDDDEFWFNTGFDKNMEDQGKSWKVDEEGNYQVKDLITGQTVDWDTDDKNNYKKQFNSAEKCFNSYLNITKDKCCDVIEKLLKGDGKEFLKEIGAGKISIGALDENFKKQNPFSIKRILKSFKWPEILTWDPFVKGKLYKYPNFDYWAKNVLPNQDLEDSEVKTIKEDANLKAILNMCVAFVNHSPQLLNPHIDPFEGTPIDVPALKERGVHYYSKATANTFDGSWNHLHKRISKPYEKWSRNNSLFTTPIFSGDSFVLARGGGLKNKGEVVLTQTRVMPDFSTLIWEDLKHVLNNLKTMTNKTLKKNEIDDINKLLNNFKELEIQLLRKILTINKYVKVAYAMNDNKNEVVSINYIKQQIAQADEYFKEYSAKDLELKNVGFYLGQFIRDKL